MRLTTTKRRTSLQVETLEDRQLMAVLTPITDAGANDPGYAEYQKIPSLEGYSFKSTLRPGIELPAPPGATGPQPRQYDNGDVYALDAKVGDTYVVKVTAVSPIYGGTPNTSKGSLISLGFSNTVGKTITLGPSSVTGSTSWKVPATGLLTLFIGSNGNRVGMGSGYDHQWGQTISYTVTMERQAAPTPPAPPSNPPVTPPATSLPDIQAVSLQSDGDRLGFKYNVVGTLKESFKVQFALSSDALYSTNDTMIGSITMSGSMLAPGSHEFWIAIGSASGNISLPGAGRPEADAAYHIVAKADADEKVGETSGKNNEASCSPDIAVSKVRYDGSFTKVAFDLAARDITKDYKVALYQSKTPKFDQTKAIKIAPDQVYTPKHTSGNFTLASAPNIQNGRYLFVVADPDKKIFETNTKNNEVRAENAWTIFVYITGCDLNHNFDDDINEMENAASRLFGVDIVALWDQSPIVQIHATDNGAQAAWSTAGQAIITADTNNAIATRFELLGEVNTGNGNTLRNFIQWGAKEAPARNYGLILSGHGAGIHGSNFDWEGAMPATLAGLEYLTIPETVSAVASSSVPYFNLLAFDECTMAMAEVAYAFQSRAAVIVSSEAKVPGTGFNYANIFKPLETSAFATGGWDLGKSFVNSYGVQYRNRPDKLDTLSLQNTSGMTALVQSLKTFTNAFKVLLDAPGTNQTAVRNSMLSIINSMPGFDDNLVGIRDLGTFMAKIRLTPSLAVLHAAAGEVVRTLNDKVVIGAKTTDQSNTYGLGIYLPKMQLSSSGTLQSMTPSHFSMYARDHQQFNTATGWGTFLNWLATRSWTPLSASATGTGAANAAAQAVSVAFSSGAKSLAPGTPSEMKTTASTQAIDAVFLKAAPAAAKVSRPLTSTMTAAAVILAADTLEMDAVDPFSLGVRRRK